MKFFASFMLSACVLSSVSAMACTDAELSKKVDDATNAVMALADKNPTKASELMSKLGEATSAITAGKSDQATTDKTCAAFDKLLADAKK